MSDIIKGVQIQTTKRGGVLLTLHRDLPKPPNAGPDWVAWIKTQDRAYRLEASRAWWNFVWPKVLRNVNIALAREVPQVIMRVNCAVWIRIADDIMISVYDSRANNWRDDGPGPFPYSALMGHLRIPIDFWNKRIDGITESIQQMAREMIAS